MAEAPVIADRDSRLYGHSISLPVYITRGVGYVRIR